MPPPSYGGRSRERGRGPEREAQQVGLPLEVALAHALQSLEDALYHEAAALCEPAEAAMPNRLGPMSGRAIVQTVKHTEAAYASLVQARALAEFCYSFYCGDENALAADMECADDLHGVCMALNALVDDSSRAGSVHSDGHSSGRVGEGAGALAEVASSFASPLPGHSALAVPPLEPSRVPPGATLDACVVCDSSECISALIEAVYPLVFPAMKPHLVGIRAPPRSILLHGPPGTGKTLMCQGLAGDLNLSYFALVSALGITRFGGNETFRDHRDATPHHTTPHSRTQTPASLLSKWAGESSKAIARAFASAHKHAPSLLFFDEVDAIARARDHGDDRASRQVLSQILHEMNALDTLVGGDRLVLVVAATNRLDDLDEALVRRFDRVEEVPLPDLGTRVQLITSFLRGVSHSLTPEAVTCVAAECAAWSGADLKRLCREATMQPVKRACMENQEHWCGGGGKDAESGPSLLVHLEAVTLADFAAAMGRIRPAAASSRQHAGQTSKDD